MQEQTSQNNSGGDKNKQPTLVYVIASIIIVMLLFIANSANDTNTVKNEQSDINNEIEKIDGMVNDRIDPSNLIQATELKNFKDLTQAKEIINTSQGKTSDKEEIEMIIYGIVESDKENMVYFATKNLNKNTGEVFTGIYHYNTETNRWHRIYKNTFIKSEDESTSYLRVIGRMGNQLILFKDNTKREKENCSSYWLMGDESEYELSLLYIDSPYSEFETFHVPQKLKDEETKRIKECLSK